MWRWSRTARFRVIAFGRRRPFAACYLDLNVLEAPNAVLANSITQCCLWDRKRLVCVWCRLGEAAIRSGGPSVHGAPYADIFTAKLSLAPLSGYTRNAVVHNGVLDPVVELLGKPFSIDESAVRVRSVLDIQVGPGPSNASNNP